MKNKVSVALRQKSPKDLSRRHFTTMNFGETYPIFVQPVIPNQTLKIRPDVFARTAPLQLPTFANINLDVSAFYVPYRYVWRWFDDFATGVKSVIGTTVRQFIRKPNIVSSLFWKLVLNNDDYPDYTVYTDSDAGFNTADFYEEIDQEDFRGYRLNAKGKYIMHICYSLGYNIPWCMYGNLDNDLSVDLLPLLSFLKIHYDYLIPNQLSDSTPFKRLFSKLDSYTDVNFRTENTDFSDFAYLIQESFNYVFSYYQSNYFTSAWCSPNSPTFDTNDNSFAFIPNQINQTIDDNFYNGQYSNSENETSVIEQTDAYIVSQDNVTILQKFSNFIKRNLLAGQRAVDRLKARFGVNVDDFEFGRCRYYGSHSTVLNKVDVTGTGDENLGEYAGKAWFNMSEKKEFTINCDHFGIVIVLGSINVASTFSDGIRHYLFDTTTLDLYQPELDGGIMQAISGSELQSRFPIHSNSLTSVLQSKSLRLGDTFGFTPRYSHLKTSIDDVTGDFALPRYGASIDGFILPRRIFDNINMLLDFETSQSPSDIYQYLYMKYSNPEDITEPITPLDVLSQIDQKQYARIFKDISGLTDMFNCVFQFDVVSYDGMLPLDSSHELRGYGKDLYFQSNGVEVQ